MIRSRLTVSGFVYHQRPGQQPEAVAIRFARDLSGTEQRYGPRDMLATETPQPLDLGWAADCGMLVIANVEGADRRTIPTPEEKADVAARVIVVGMLVIVSNCAREFFPVLSIRPGESAQFEPATAGLTIVCRKGIARYQITAIPA